MNSNLISHMLWMASFTNFAYFRDSFWFWYLCKYLYWTVYNLYNLVCMKNEGKRCLNSMISELRSGEEMCRKFACVNNSNVVQYNKERKKTPFFLYGWWCSSIQQASIQYECSTPLVYHHAKSVQFRSLRKLDKLILIIAENQIFDIMNHLHSMRKYWNWIKKKCHQLESVYPNIHCWQKYGCNMSISLA